MQSDLACFYERRALISSDLSASDKVSVDLALLCELGVFARKLHSKDLDSIYVAWRHLLLAICGCQYRFHDFHDLPDLPVVQRPGVEDDHAFLDAGNDRGFAETQT